MGTSAPSRLRARVVAESGTPAGIMGPVLSRGGARSPARSRGSRGSGSRDDAEAHARGALPGSCGTMRGRSFARGARTPGNLVNGYRGGGTRAHSLARNEAGVMIRQRETRRDDFFTRYEPAAVPQDAEAREREGRAKAVPVQSLSAEIIVGVDGEARVHVEAVARDGFVDERGAGSAGPSLSPVSSLTFSRMPRCVASRASISAKVRPFVSFEAWSSSFTCPRLRSHVVTRRAIRSART
jgi:hypothetical protein